MMKENKKIFLPNQTMANPCPPGQHAGRGSNQYATKCEPDEPSFTLRAASYTVGLPRAASAGYLSPRVASGLSRAASAGYLSPRASSFTGSPMQNWGNQYAHHPVPAYPHGHQASLSPRSLSRTASLSSSPRAASLGRAGSRGFEGHYDGHEHERYSHHGWY